MHSQDNANDFGKLENELSSEITYQCAPIKIC